jgi:hypothetical protein
MDRADILNHRLKRSRCTNCGSPNDSALPIDNERRPQSGDFTVCIYCNHLMVYDDSMELRDPNDDEIKSIAGDQRILIAMRVVEEGKNTLNK